MADEILAIADAATEDTSLTGKGSQIVHREHIERARLRIDARKWLLARLLPSVYGDQPPILPGGAGTTVIVNVVAGDRGL
jgi:hypothetical protein